MNWQEPDDERSNEPGGDFDELGSRRWPLDWHSLYPRERWIWFEQLWTDVCMLRPALPPTCPLRLVGAPAPGRGARRTSRPGSTCTTQATGTTRSANSRCSTTSSASPRSYAKVTSRFIPTAIAWRSLAI